MHGIEDNVAEHMAAGERDGSSVTNRRGERQACTAASEQGAGGHDSQDVFVAEVLLEVHKARTAPRDTVASIEASR